MKVQLLVADWSPACGRAQQVWQTVAQERQFELTVVDVDQPEGQATMQRLQLQTIPALLIDGQLVAIGVQSWEAALAIVDAAQRKTPPSPPG
jgi:thioredoxin-like negative regulator of GroEL